ncbi:MAG TPA: PAS domain S-box protein [Thermoanaerobaculia bacterium]|nr:PAS domain S-box protein [Thermoanaerobaculia bacterium]
MPPQAPRPADEPKRLAALRRYGILDTPPEPAFDDLAKLASEICETPMALVTLIDEDRQWFKARVNVHGTETSRDIAFCSYTVMGKDLLVVPDAREDGRFSHNPFVTGDPGIRFYAGAPLVTPDGSSVGSLCVADSQPRELTPHQADALRALSRLVVAQMELKRRMADERERADRVIRVQERTLSAADEVIRNQEQTLAVTLSQLPAILWTTDTDLRFTGATGSGREVLADADQDVRGTTLFAYFRTTDPEYGPIEAHRRALKGESVTYEAIWEGRTFQSHVEPLRGSDGEIRGVIGIAFDVTPRKDAELELERSVALLEATIDATADGILVVDAAGKMVHFNQQFVDMWDVPNDVVESGDENKAIASVVAKLKDPASFVKKVMTVYAQPSAFSHDVIELLDGRRIERDSRPQVVEGRTVGRVWSFRDVTERERAEREREESLSLLRATLEATADGVLCVDREGRIVSYNRKFVEMWGIPESVMISRDDSRALAYVLGQLRDPERFVKKVKELYDQPEAQSYDWLEFKDGRMFERYSHPQQINGKTVGRVWSFHDVTRLRLMEDTVRRHARAFDHISDAVITLDLQAHIVEWNPGAERMFGFTKEQMIGHTPDRLRAPGIERTATELIADMRREGRWSGEIHFVRADGVAGVCDTVVVPLADDFGRTIAALAVCRDVTDRKRLEEYRRRETGG